MEDNKKNVDESWKKEMEKEKQETPQDGKFIPPAPDFNFFITTLALQASIGLGVLANPATNEKQEDLQQAKFIIDTLGILKDKTKNNLTQEENNLLENVLYELRMQYMAKTGEKK